MVGDWAMYALCEANDGTTVCTDREELEQSDGSRGTAVWCYTCESSSPGRRRETVDVCLFLCVFLRLARYGTVSCACTLRTRVSSQRWAVTREMRTEKAERQSGRALTEAEKVKEAHARSTHPREDKRAVKLLGGREKMR